MYHKPPMSSSASTPSVIQSHSSERLGAAAASECALGSCAITTPSGTLGLYSRTTCWVRPAACSFESASASGSPMTSGSPTCGTGLGALPFDTMRMTAIPCGAVRPPSGSWPITLPRATVAL